MWGNSPQPERKDCVFSPLHLYIQILLTHFPTIWIGCFSLHLHNFQGMRGRATDLYQSSHEKQGTIQVWTVNLYVVVRMSIVNHLIIHHRRQFYMLESDWRKA